MQRQLGSSGLTVSPVIFGAMGLGPRQADDDARVDLFRFAFDHGVTSIDTAPLYGFGHSESLVGRALEGWRDRVQVLTKVGLRWDDAHGDPLFWFQNDRGQMCAVRKDSRPESVRAEVEASLERLEVERLDLVQVHHPDVHTPIPETMGALSALHREGKVGAIGVSNYSAAQMAEAAEALGDLPLASNQVQYSLVCRQVEDDVLPRARSDGVGILAYSPLEQGLLGGGTLGRRLAASDGRHDRWTFWGTNRRAINDALQSTVAPIARAHGVSLAEVAMAWLLAQPGVTAVVAGASTRAQVEAQARAAALELEPSEAAGIRAVFESLDLDETGGPDARVRMERLARRVAHRLRRALRK